MDNNSYNEGVDLSSQTERNRKLKRLGVGIPIHINVILSRDFAFASMGPGAIQ